MYVCVTEEANLMTTMQVGSGFLQPYVMLTSLRAKHIILQSPALLGSYLSAAAFWKPSHHAQLSVTQLR